MKIHLHIFRENKQTKQTKQVNKQNINNNNYKNVYRLSSQEITNIGIEMSGKTLFSSSSKNMIPRPFTAKTQHKYYKSITENTVQIQLTPH